MQLDAFHEFTELIRSIQSATRDYKTGSSIKVETAHFLFTGRPVGAPNGEYQICEFQLIFSREGTRFVQAVELVFGGSELNRLQFDAKGLIRRTLKVGTTYQLALTLSRQLPPEVTHKETLNDRLGAGWKIGGRKAPAEKTVFFRNDQGEIIAVAVMMKEELTNPGDEQTYTVEIIVSGIQRAVVNLRSNEWATMQSEMTSHKCARFTGIQASTFTTADILLLPLFG